jgi:probable F420-dependent oxidoreductase
MIIDAMLDRDLRNVGDSAAALEALGVGGLWAAETSLPAWSSLLVAAGRTDAVRLGSCVTIAFARSPMALAYDVAATHQLAPGRLAIGLGSQTKQHITRRYDGSWSSPVARMVDYVGALRAIWSSWATGAPLRYRGSHHRHTLMTPFFAPPVVSERSPEIHLAAVGPAMAAAAGRVADGVLFHPMATTKYLRDVLRPAIAAGSKSVGRAPSEVSVGGEVWVVTGDEEAMGSGITAVRHLLAFYASTPSYLPMLRCHGLEDLQRDARNVILRRRWDLLGLLVPEEVVEKFAIVAEPGRVRAALANRFADLVDRVIVGLPGRADQMVAVWTEFG